MGVPKGLLKIEKLELGETVIQLRQSKTVAEVARILTDSKGVKIHAMDIARWEKQRNIVPSKAIIAIGVPLDTYAEVVNINNLMTAHIGRIETEITKYKLLYDSPGFQEEMKDQHKVNSIPVDLLNAYSAALEKKHKAALDMVKLEKELLNPANTKKHLTAVVKALKETNREFQQYQKELVEKLKITIPVFDIEQQYKKNLQESQAEWEEMKAR